MIEGLSFFDLSGVEKILSASSSLTDKDNKFFQFMKAIAFTNYLISLQPIALLALVDQTLPINLYSNKAVVSSFVLVYFPSYDRTQVEYEIIDQIIIGRVAESRIPSQRPLEEHLLAFRLTSNFIVNSFSLIIFQYFALALYLIVLLARLVERRYQKKRKELSEHLTGEGSSREGLSSGEDVL